MCSQAFEDRDKLEREAERPGEIPAFLYLCDQGTMPVATEKAKRFFFDGFFDGCNKKTPRKALNY